MPTAGQFGDCGCNYEESNESWPVSDECREHSQRSHYCKPVCTIFYSHQKRDIAERRGLSIQLPETMRLMMFYLVKTYT